MSTVLSDPEIQQALQKLPGLEAKRQSDRADLSVQ